MSRFPRLSLACLWVGLLIAWRGQLLLSVDETTATGGWLFLGGVVIFGAGMAAMPHVERNWSRVAQRPFLPLFPRKRPFYPILAGFCIGFAILAYIGLAHNQFTPSGTIAWLTSLLLFLLLFAEYPADWRTTTPHHLWRLAPWRRTEWTIRIRREHLILFTILLLAAFFRFYRLAELPLDMWSDQAEKLLDVNDVLNGARPIFFERNTGREAVQFYLTAVIIRLTGLPVGFMALKLGTTLISLLTVPLVYLLGREMYGRSLGWVAATLTAVSHWHVAISRVGLRFPFTPAFFTPVLFFLVRAFKYNRRNDWLACGLTLGIGLHTYIPMRIVPLLLVILCFIKAIWDLNEWYRKRPNSLETSSLTITFWQNATLGGFAALLTFLPLGRYMRDNPTMFWYRAATRALSDSLTPADLWRIFWQNVKNALLMFNYRGDVVPTNTIPLSPVLDTVTGVLFVLGIVYLLWQLIRWRDRRSLYLLIAFFIMLMPSTLSFAFPRENPSVVRTGGAIPLVMMIAAMPVVFLYRQTIRYLPRAGTAVITGSLLLLIIWQNYTWYFIDYSHHYRQTVWNTTEMAQVARGFADSIGDMTHVYHVAYPYWADTRLIGINAGLPGWENAITDIQQLDAHRNDPAPKLYLLHVDDRAAQARLRLLFPAGHLWRHHSVIGPKKDFMVYFVPGEPEQH